jgi:hypothetical protein
MRLSAKSAVQCFVPWWFKIRVHPWLISHGRPAFGQFPCFAFRFSLDGIFSDGLYPVGAAFAAGLAV